MTKTAAKSRKTAPKPAAKKAPGKSVANKKPPAKAASAKAAAKPLGKKPAAKPARKAAVPTAHGAHGKAAKAGAPAPKTAALPKGEAARKTPTRTAVQTATRGKAPPTGLKAGASRAAIESGTQRAAQPQPAARLAAKATTQTAPRVGAGKPSVTTPVASARSAEAARTAAALPMEPASSASRFAARFSPARPAARVVAFTDVEVLRPAVKSDPRLANAWKSKAGRDLTDDELLAMPDGEYMNEKQLEFFRARLQHLKDDLLSNADETTEHLREDTTIVPDPADRATIEEEHALELRTRDRERKLLKKITQSLARIDSGEYGFCDETGEPIGLPRLLARPTATLSLEAQQRREMKQKMFGD